MGRHSGSTVRWKKPWWHTAARRANAWRARCPPKPSQWRDATCTGGLCLVGIEARSNSLLLEQAAQARDHDSWQRLMEQALTGRHCQEMQSTSAEAPGLLASVAQHLGAHNSPDLFHVQ